MPSILCLTAALCFISVALVMRFIVVVAVFFHVNIAFSAVIVTHTSPENINDRIEYYEIELLQLALSKTVDAFGQFELQELSAMNQLRARQNMSDGVANNFVRVFPYNAALEQDYALTFVPFPIHLGMLSYRVCFTPRSIKAEFAASRSLSDLKKYKFGMGTGWFDISIFRENGLEVHSVPNYESLFKMTERGRVDALCRGVSEVFHEKEAFSDLERLNLDHGVLIYYPLPCFFYVNKKDSAIAERILIGLTLAVEDGSLQQLWQTYHAESISKVNLNDRRFIRLKNTHIETLELDYEQYFLDLDSVIE